ncbi:MAG: hypothetical protein DCF22_06025, partial [Leptolyngbya sp.]
VITPASGGSLAAGSLWFWAVGMNRVGLNRASTGQQVTWTVNQKLVITLASTFRTAVEALQRVVILANTTNNLATAQPVAWWKGVTLTAAATSGFFLETPATLPATIELSTPAQIVLGGVVANPAALTALASPLPGQQRYVTSLVTTFYYEPSSTATVDNTTVISAATGRWLKWILPDSFALGSISDVAGVRGCSRDARSLIDSDILFPAPAYPMDGTDGQAVNYWLCNGLDETGSDITAGSRIALDVFQSLQPKSQLMSGRLQSAIAGYVRVSDASLDTASLTVNANQTYKVGIPVYTLEKALPSGYGVVLKIFPRFRQEEIDGGLTSALLSVKPYFSTQAGNFFSGYPLFGDLIYSTGDRRRIYPKRGLTARVGSGSGLVQWFAFDKQAAQDLTIPVASVSNQKIAIDSNGSIFWRGSSALQPTEAQRAIVSLATGRSNASAFTSYTAAALNTGIQVTLTYPAATIRADYPDVIAGAGSAQGVELNPPKVAIYAQRQSDGQIREFTTFAVVPGASQVFQLTSFTSGTVIGSVPSTAGNFGFFASATTPALVIQSGGGTFAADSYRIAWAWLYDGTTLSSISHSTADGCITEFNQPLGELAAAIALVNAQITAWNNGTDDITVSQLLQTGLSMLLNSDAAQSGADWRYSLNVPATGMTANQALTLPTNQGQAQQALIGDGAGVLQYASVIRSVPLAFNFGAAATTNFFTLIAGDFLRRIECQVIVTFNGTAPTIAIGIAGNTGKYVASGLADLKSASGSLLGFSNQLDAPSADEPIILTYAASSSTVGSARLIAHYFG